MMDYMKPDNNSSEQLQTYSENESVSLNPLPIYTSEPRCINGHSLTNFYTEYMFIRDTDFKMCSFEAFIYY